MRSNLKWRVKTVMACHLALNVSQLGNELRLVDDLCMDSLDLLDMVMALNEEFGIDLGEAELAGFTTVAGVCRAVQKQLIL